MVRQIDKCNIDDIGKAAILFKKSDKSLDKSRDKLTHLRSRFIELKKNYKYCIENRRDIATALLTNLEEQALLEISLQDLQSRRNDSTIKLRGLLKDYVTQDVNSKITTHIFKDAVKFTLAEIDTKLSFYDGQTQALCEDNYFFESLLLTWYECFRTLEYKVEEGKEFSREKATKAFADKQKTHTRSIRVMLRKALSSQFAKLALDSNSGVDEYFECEELIELHATINQLNKKESKENVNEAKWILYNSGKADPDIDYYSKDTSDEDIEMFF